MIHANYFKSLKQQAAMDGIVLIRARKGDGDKQGIHLLRPSRDELCSAIDDALQDNFTTIYVHARESSMAGPLNKE